MCKGNSCKTITSSVWSIYKTTLQCQTLHRTMSVSWHQIKNSARVYVCVRGRSRQSPLHQIEHITYTNCKDLPPHPSHIQQHSDGLHQSRAITCTNTRQERVTSTYGTQHLSLNTQTRSSWHEQKLTLLEQS